MTTFKKSTSIASRFEVWKYITASILFKPNSWGPPFYLNTKACEFCGTRSSERISPEESCTMDNKCYECILREIFGGNYVTRRNRVTRCISPYCRYFQVPNRFRNRIQWPQPRSPHQRPLVRSWEIVDHQPQLPRRDSQQSVNQQPQKNENGQPESSSHSGD